MEYPKLLFGHEDTSSLFHEIFNDQAVFSKVKRSAGSHIIVTNIRNSLEIANKSYNWWLDTRAGQRTIGVLVSIALAIVIIILVATIYCTYWKPRIQ